MEWWHWLGAVLVMMGSVPLALDQVGLLEFDIPGVADSVEAACSYFVYVGGVLGASALPLVPFLVVAAVLTSMLYRHVRSRIVI